MIKLADTLAPMADFPAAYAKDIEFDDGKNLQEKLNNGELGGGGGGSTGEDQIVFSKLADFPAVGESDKVYIDTDTSKSYIFTNNVYKLVGDGYSTTDWGLIS